MPEFRIDCPDNIAGETSHNHLHFRRTKIIATIGPASSSPAMLESLIRHGLNVARINFSHGKPQEHIATIAAIRRAADKQKASVAILGDLCGPKIRTGCFAGGSAVLRDNSVVCIIPRPVTGDALVIPSQYARIAKEVKPGHRILLDDGNLELKVLSTNGSEVKARVIRGGVLKDHKGINLPDTKLAVCAVTAKDRSDLEYCVKGGVDYIALSFVRHSRDVKQLKRILAKMGSDIPVIAKIEKPEALVDTGAILEAADGIMVARGDLGVELPARKVPIIQSRLIELANQCNKPVIVATQMLESMIVSARPTRAEVTDVSFACMSGADAVMLSAETATGKHPVEAVKTMDSILRETEAYQFHVQKGAFRHTAQITPGDVQDSIGMASAGLSRDLNVRCIFVPTRSGRTVRMISADRPASPIIALACLENVGRRLNLLWGVYPYQIPGKLELDQSLKIARRIVSEQKLGKPGDYIIMISGSGSVITDTISITVHKL
jgi:pyruvate kinase